MPGAGRAHDPEGLLDVAGWYAADAEAGELSAALDRLVVLPWWPAGYDGSLRDLAALKDMTSSLIGRLCTAADEATRAEFGPGRLTRYGASLIVPREQRMEVAVLKAIANLWVMQRLGMSYSGTFNHPDAGLQWWAPHVLYRARRPDTTGVTEHTRIGCQMPPHARQASLMGHAPRKAVSVTDAATGAIPGQSPNPDVPVERRR